MRLRIGAESLSHCRVAAGVKETAFIHTISHTLIIAISDISRNAIGDKTPNCRGLCAFRSREVMRGGWLNWLRFVIRASSADWRSHAHFTRSRWQRARLQPKRSSVQSHTVILTRLET